MRSAAQPLPAQFIHRTLQQPRRALIEMHDLEIDRLAVSIANRGQRDDAFIGHAEDRIEQIVLRPALIDIDADQNAAPARSDRQCKHIVNPDKTVAHAMPGRKIRLAGGPRIRDGLAHCQRAVRRASIERRVPYAGVEPLLDISSGAGNHRALAVLPDEHGVVREAAEAAQHHVLEKRQLHPGLESRLPFPAQDRNVAEQFRTGRSLFRLSGNHNALPHRHGILSCQRAHPMRVRLKQRKRCG